MNRDQKTRFQKQVQQVAEKARGWSIRIDGSESITAAVTWSPVRVELDRGRKSLKNIYVSVSKATHEAEPTEGMIVIVDGNESDAYSIYEVSGHDNENWSFRAALFPENR